MKKQINYFKKKFSLSDIDRKAIALLTSSILLLTCTITGCGSPNQSVPEQSDMEQPSQDEAAPSPEVSLSSPPYLGTWQITSSTFGAYSAMSIPPNISKALRPLMIFRPSGTKKLTNESLKSGGGDSF